MTQSFDRIYRIIYKSIDNANGLDSNFASEAIFTPRNHDFSMLLLLFLSLINDISVVNRTRQ